MEKYLLREQQSAFPYVLGLIYLMVHFSGMQGSLCVSGYRYNLSKHILKGLYWLSMFSHVASFCSVLNITHSRVIYILI